MLFYPCCKLFQSFTSVRNFVFGSFIHLRISKHQACQYTCKPRYGDFHEQEIHGNIRFPLIFKYCIPTKVPRAARRHNFTLTAMSSCHSLPVLLPSSISPLQLYPLNIGKGLDAPSFFPGTRSPPVPVRRSMQMCKLPLQIYQSMLQGGY